MFPRPAGREFRAKARFEDERFFSSCVNLAICAQDSEVPGNQTSFFFNQLYK